MSMDTRMTDALLRSYGQTATLTVGGTPSSIEGVYSGPYQEIPVGNTLVSRRDHQLAVRSTDWVAASGRPGATVQLADGSNFTVVSHAPDHGGMTKLLLRAYA